MLHSIYIINKVQKQERLYKVISKDTYFGGKTTKRNKEVIKSK